MSRPDDLPEQVEMSLTIDLGDEESPFVAYKRTFTMPFDMDDPRWDKVYRLLDELVEQADHAIDAHDRSMDR